MAGIAHSHPFEQGNKRTAFVALGQFLNANGLDIAIEDSGIMHLTYRYNLR